MIVVAVVLVVVLLTGGVVLRTRYRHAKREPARSCLAPNRSRGRNKFCQNPTPRGGYCSVHHNQHTLDNGAITASIALGVVAVVVAAVLQAQQ